MNAPLSTFTKWAESQEWFLYYTVDEFSYFILPDGNIAIVECDEDSNIISARRLT